MSPPVQTADGRIRAVVSHIDGTNQPATFAANQSGANYQEIPLFYGIISPSVGFMAQPSDGNLWGILGKNVFSFTLKGVLLAQIPYSDTGSPAVLLLQAGDGTLVGLGTSESLGSGEVRHGTRGNLYR